MAPISLLHKRILIVDQDMSVDSEREEKLVRVCVCGKREEDDKES